MDTENLLGSLGYIFPQNKSQLDSFDSIHANYDYKANELAVNPERILKKIEFEKIIPTHIDFHQRIVLAAEIVFQLKDDKHLGHLKLEKMLYLCRNVANISLYVNFLKQAMGPYDPVLMRSLDKQFEKNQWIKYNRDSFPKYTPLAKFGEHRTWYNRYFKEQEEEIDSLIKTFRIFSGDQIELVVTIFDCWKNILEDGIDFSDNLIKRRVYSWSENKKKFTEEQIENAISWMLEKGLTPII